MAVMNVKRGTTTFTKGDGGGVQAQESSGANSVDAAEFQKAFGDQSVGDVANKIADGNWVDPSKKPRAVGNAQLDKDAFLKLMLAQMKHQDPTNPLQSHEMAAQLAQFTSLEQLNNINTTLTGIKDAQNPQGNYQALALIGKKASGDSSKLVRAAGDTKHSFAFDLPGDAQKATVTVKDSAGNIVRKMEVGALKKGKNSIEWNGVKEDGMPAHAGEYKFSVEAQSTSGQKLFAKTTFGGRITGLNYTPEGPVLIVGQSTIRLSDVKKIEEMSSEDIAQDATPKTPLGAPQGVPPEAMKMMEQMTGMKAAPPAAQTSEENIPAAEESASGNIQDVPMASQLLNEVNVASSGRK